jgi:hypothetical protein
MAIPLKQSRLNNLKLGYQRNDLTYEAVMIDLCLLGIIDKDICEAMTGRIFPENVRLPENALELEEERNAATA